MRTISHTHTLMLNFNFNKLFASVHIMNIYTQIFTNQFYYAGLSWELPCDLFGPEKILFLVQLLLLLDGREEEGRERMA